jgi:hypothetical protein
MYFAETRGTVAHSVALSGPTLDGLRREWHRLGAAGTWWSGAERVAIARVARLAGAGEVPHEDQLSDVAVEATATVAAAPTKLSANVIERFISEGLSTEKYTEIVGVVARVVAVDTAVRGSGAPLEQLPAPEDGAPSRTIVAAAKKRSAWIPMVGGSNPVTALSAVAAESEAQRDLHAALYLSYEQMGDLSIVKQLNRAQLELVAARTSFINECVF